jgi:uncharacterized protein (TIGR02444 family)
LTNNRFWDFSLDIYSTPGVSRVCLQAQDEAGIDVNLLLLAAYLGTLHYQLTSDEIYALSQLVGRWQQGVVVPFRNIRNEMKRSSFFQSSSISGAADEFLQQVKLLELSAEKIEQDVLFEWVQRHLAGTNPETKSPEAIRRNILSVAPFLSESVNAGQIDLLVQASLNWKAKP